MLEQRKLRSLVAITHVPHAVRDGSVMAYAPYAHEMSQWCRLFERVTIAAPIASGTQAGDWEPITARNIVLHPVLVPSGSGVVGVLRRLLYAPRASLRIVKAMRQADVVHVRCPGYLGLLGAVLAPMIAKRTIAKYAGEWDGVESASLATHVQLRVLRSSWWRGPVLAYTREERGPAHVVPFFSAALSTEQMQRAARAVARPPRWPLRQVLFVGRLSRAKNVHVLLRAIATLRREGLALTCDVVGEGAERESLENLSLALGLAESVRFHGGMSLEHVLARYEEADVLVLPSETEGWPKALLEGMAFGLMCIGPNRGIVPWIAAGGGAWTVTPGREDSLTRTLRECADLQREEVLRRRQMGARLAHQYTLETLADCIASVMTQAWSTPLATAVAGSARG